jgi:thiol-disulfide isomerase/thioredoxin
MTERTRRGGTGRILGAAAALGLAAGIGAVYVSGGFSGNGAGATDCSAAAPAVARMAPHAIGEVAAFIVERRPVPAPDLAFRDGEGRERRLSEFRGRAVLLNLWATWCAPCRHEMPALDQLQATLGGPAFDVVAVSIDLGDATRPRNFYRDTNIQRLTFYQDPSGRVFQDLRAVGRAVGMPTTVMLDAQGCILGHLAGPAEWSSTDALRLVRAALGAS